ncbi:WSC domain-containing protein [Lineolata rhizophorae]|uniref:WSC domain-containing protein n=1 Tax=Lineolata rhizophorae TaxID=578093 RepID=A0A6A6NLN6_9PEZI|nr:WSC domain-containing protein [Lineolata rhizophorae]
MRAASLPAHSLFYFLVCFLFICNVLALDASDTYRDADLGQTSYVGGDHNMDPAIVDSSQFGLLWKIPFNNKERFYAKPLVYTPESTGRQIVFLASTQNIIRTVDARTGELINERQLDEPFLQSDIGCTDIPDTIGIVGTPTIDPNTDTAYFYVKTYIANFRTEGEHGVVNGVYKFYAVDVKTLEDIDPFPILVDGSIADNDDRRYFVGGVILQRVSLVQLGNYVYAGFGGHCDLFNYTGTVLGVDVTNGDIVANWAVQTGPHTAFSTDYYEVSGMGGIWHGGSSFATDGSRLFFVTGNGRGHENDGVPASGRSGCKTLGEAAVNLNVGDDGSLSLVDYFQPYDFQNMDGGDQDFGSGGMSLLDPDVFYGTGVTRMGLTAGKNGKIYVLNADDLGGYKMGSGGTDGILQTIVTNRAVFGGAGTYPGEGGYVYYTPVGYPTYVYKLGHDESGKPVLSQVGQSPETSAGRVGVGIPTVTTNKGQAGSAILWMTDPDAGMRAWYAVPGEDGLLKSIPMPQIGGVNKFQRPAFGNTRFYTTDANGVLYCIGSPVNLPLNCTAVDFGDVPLGSSKEAEVTCSVLIPIDEVKYMTVEDDRFEIDNATLPEGPLAEGDQFSIPVTWNLTTADLENTPGASYGYVTPGIKSTPLTIFTTNGVDGYVSELPVSLSGNIVSEDPYFDMTPTTVDFGGLVLGLPGEEPTNSLPFTFANRGSSPLIILGYAYTYDEAVEEGGEESDAVWTNCTQTDGVWDLGEGFTSSNLPAIDAVLDANSELSVTGTFSAVRGVDAYHSYFKAFTDGGDKFTILEGSASTAPKANFSISTAEGGWLPESVLEMDFGAVSPGNTAERIIRICNNGGSPLTITKSKPPVGIITAEVPGVDFHEGQNINIGECAYAPVIFEPEPQQANVADFEVTDSWTLNVNDLDFGVHVVEMVGIVRSDPAGPTYENGTALYTYLGCYQDGPRILPEGRTPDDHVMDISICTQACYDEGYIFAGTEYNYECWCGNNPPPGSRFQPEEDDRCTFTCTNNIDQICGGNGGYISVFYDSSRYTPTDYVFDPDDGPSTVMSIGAYEYVGCYSEVAGRALSDKTVAAGELGGSVDYCEEACRGYKYFGVEYADECYCGDTLKEGSELVPGDTPEDTGCDMQCGGNLTQYCGGGGRLGLYELVDTSTISSSSLVASSTISSSESSTQSVSVSSSSGVDITASTTSSSVASTSDTSTSSTELSSSTTTSSSATPTGPTVVPSAGEFTHIGCYIDSGPRTLHDDDLSTEEMTVELCADFCSGYKYMGVEWSRECWCGNIIDHDGAPAENGCDMTCAGDSFQYCGGSMRLNLYVNETEHASSSSSTATSSASSSTTDSSSETDSSISTSSSSSQEESSTTITTAISSTDYLTTTGTAATSSSTSATEGSTSSSDTDSSTHDVSTSPTAPTSTSAEFSTGTATSSCIPATPTVFECPEANNTLYAADDVVYRIECGVDYTGGDIPGGSKGTGSFKECADYCSTFDDCVVFSFNHWPKLCYCKNNVHTANDYGHVWSGKKLEEEDLGGVTICS